MEIASEEVRTRLENTKEGGKKKLKWKSLFEIQEEFKRKHVKRGWKRKMKRRQAIETTIKSRVGNAESGKEAKHLMQKEDLPLVKKKKSKVTFLTHSGGGTKKNNRTRLWSGSKRRMGGTVTGQFGNKESGNWGKVFGGTRFQNV